METKNNVAFVIDDMMDEENGLIPKLRHAMKQMILSEDDEKLQLTVENNALLAEQLYDLNDEISELFSEYAKMRNKREAIQKALEEKQAASIALMEEMKEKFGIAESYEEVTVNETEEQELEKEQESEQKDSEDIIDMSDLILDLDGDEKKEIEVEDKEIHEEEQVEEIQYDIEEEEEVDLTDTLFNFDINNELNDEEDDDEDNIMIMFETDSEHDDIDIDNMITDSIADNNMVSDEDLFATDDIEDNSFIGNDLADFDARDKVENDIIDTKENIDSMFELGQDDKEDVFEGYDAESLFGEEEIPMSDLIDVEDNESEQEQAEEENNNATSGLTDLIMQDDGFFD